MKLVFANLSDQTLLQLTIGLLIIPSLYLMPREHSCTAFVCFVSAFLLFIYFSRSQIESKPFEWLIGVKNKKIVEIGMGISARKVAQDSIIKFQEKINSIKYSAKGTVQESQGVRIEGKVFWRIETSGDGLMYYENNIKNNTDNSVRALVEGIIKNYLTNSSYASILTERENIQNEVKEKSKNKLKEQGISLFLFTIDAIIIEDDRIFQMLQKKYRISLQQHIEQTQIKNRQEIEIYREKKNAQAEKYRLQKEKEEKKFQYMIQSQRKKLQIQFEKEKQMIENEIKRKPQTVLKKEKEIKEKIQIESSKGKKQIEKQWEKFNAYKQQKLKEFSTYLQGANLQKYKIDSEARNWEKVLSQAVVLVSR